MITKSDMTNPYRGDITREIALEPSHWENIQLVAKYYQWPKNRIIRIALEEYWRRNQKLLEQATLSQMQHSTPLARK